MTTSKEAAIAAFAYINECIGPGNYSWRDDHDTFNDIISELAKIIDHVDRREATLVPTINAAVADTGDFEECCMVCGVPTEGGHTPNCCVEYMQGFEQQVHDFLVEQNSTATKHLRSVIEICDEAGRAYAEGKCTAETIGAAERAIRDAREFLEPQHDTAPEQTAVLEDEECGLCERCVSNVPEQKLTEWVGQGINICDDCRAWMVPGSPGLILKIVRENLAKLGLTEEEIAKLETEGVES